MSTALAYHEPYRFSAGLLALLVHLAFFFVLYFGVRWQPLPTREFMVEMWDNLPNTEVVPEQSSPSPARVEPAPPAKVSAPVSPPVKADIEVREKKSRKAEAKEKAVKKDEKKKAAAKARREAEEKELEAYSEQRRQDVQKQMHAEAAAATQMQIETYQDRIRNKIRRKMKMVADVPDSAEAVFKVTLLPDGMLMDDPVLVKSSGFPAYDDAAERAILSAEPLPVPADAMLQKMFRELELKIRP